ncbi:MAG TPA: hypothetical protein VNE39_06610 [Planctomycetota bacterium]|nr:hypothetical protein [Planctomycetota bacterium]
MPERAVQKKAKAAEWGLFWWGLAVALHLGVGGALIYLTPLREWFFARAEPEDMMKTLQGQKVRRIVAAMLEVHAKRIGRKIDEQKAVLADLEAYRDQRYERYAKDAAKGGTPPEPLASLGPAGPNATLSLEGRTIPELYEIATLINETTYGTYRQMRAVELARIQSIPLQEASDVTQIAVPLHAPLRVAVFEADIENTVDGKLQALKDELSKVHSEVNSMLASALRMRDMAEGLVGADVGGIRVVSFGGGALYQGGGDGQWGSSVGPPLLAHEFFPGGQESRFGPDLRPLPARKLMAREGPKPEWAYLDTWYLIGPFPNPDRAHLDKKFPPESAVDLDATYQGKDGRPLRWQFKQFNQLMIAPIAADRYAIWYGYTEVYVDKPQERWVAFGSDDYSKAWLNGELVWASGKTPHRWIPDRGFRKLKFREGYNTLLVKLENAGGTTGYSVMIYLGEGSL